VASAPVRDQLDDHLITPENGWVSLGCELQRDWARLETVPAVVEIVLTGRLLKG
jgi:hypothetical protein